MLYFEGRADSQVKVRGHRIDLEEINAIFNQCEHVTKAAVICYKPGEPEQVSTIVRDFLSELTA